MAAKRCNRMKKNNMLEIPLRNRVIYFVQNTNRHQENRIQTSRVPFFDRLLAFSAPNENILWISMFMFGGCFSPKSSTEFCGAFVGLNVDPNTSTSFVFLCGLTMAVTGLAALLLVDWMRAGASQDCAAADFAVVDAGTALVVVRQSAPDVSGTK